MGHFGRSSSDFFGFQWISSDFSGFLQISVDFTSFQLISGISQNFRGFLVVVYEISTRCGGNKIKEEEEECILLYSCSLATPAHVLLPRQSLPSSSVAPAVHSVRRILKIHFIFSSSPPDTTQ